MFILLFDFPDQGDLLCPFIAAGAVQEICVSPDSERGTSRGNVRIYMGCALELLRTLVWAAAGRDL
jgi:hypothetical protein